jgi:hypothetical protein
MVDPSKFMVFIPICHCNNIKTCRYGFTIFRNKKYCLNNLAIPDLPDGFGANQCPPTPQKKAKKEHRAVPLRPRLLPNKMPRQQKYLVPPDAASMTVYSLPITA